MEEIKHVSINGQYVEVRVMAKAESYAMVRRKGCVPFIVRKWELLRLNPCDLATPKAVKEGEDE